ncbi:hypothetical protein CPAR01_12403 [Colletotrichum paranaense]|uniref:Uncharacterized protein n=1 Tax=Colletotrichum paranaense TaxID=1914294 RepID=A0ABQ9S7C8_9PEZI|nr:uncharacterized protein CPAR01_12403 [Colletotrichum paranaense]KAK1527845.1 hypothetical protein CPAR01_12403 [Colletotrichum paranaense]
MGREGEFPSLSAITRTQPSKHPFKRAPEGYAISDYSWYSAHSAPANRRHHLFPLCTIMTRSRRTKVRGGGMHCLDRHATGHTTRLRILRVSCIWTTVSPRPVIYPGSSRRRTHNSIPYRCPLHNLLRQRRDGIIPQISISHLLMQRLFDNLRRQSFWNIVKRPCSDLRLPRKEPSK